MHKCPGPDCTEQVDDKKLMCVRHWFRVPKVLRDNVWREYKAGPGSEDHMHAILAASKSLEKEPA